MMKSCHLVKQSKTFNSLYDFNSSSYLELKKLADDAIQNNKIFIIYGPYPNVRKCLRERGWVEKFITISGNNKRQENTKSSNNLDNCEDDKLIIYDDEGFKIDPNDHGQTIAPWIEKNGYYGLLSRFVRHYQPNLIWCIRRASIDSKMLTPCQIINHFLRTNFTTKAGLCSQLKDLVWFERESCDNFYPRCYCIYDEDEREAFIDDFFLTACMSLLKIVHRHHVNNESTKKSNFLIQDRLIIIAIDKCNYFLQSLRNEDLDCSSKISKYDEDYFLKNFTKISSLDQSTVSCSSHFNTNIVGLITVLQETWPQFFIDGVKNIWILKPAAKSRGRGIECSNNLEKLLKFSDISNVIQEGKFVVQKYIERPLLIYHTKFDIRQWFLVTNWNPLTIYFYNQCYLRFCSRPFTLKDMDSSIHLSNNSIQKNYSNENRCPELPEENMWDNHQLINYLKSIGIPVNVWHNIVYSGMKKAIISSLKCAQNEIEYRKNTFELFGADFMLDEKLHPWLIEINLSPCMAPSTSITANMCARVIEDTFRVVIDRKDNRNVNIGNFELVYRQAVVGIPAYIGHGFQVEGHTLMFQQPSIRNKKVISSVHKNSNIENSSILEMLSNDILSENDTKHFPSLKIESSAKNLQVSYKMKRNLNINHKNSIQNLVSIPKIINLKYNKSYKKVKKQKSIDTIDTKSKNKICSKNVYINKSKSFMETKYNNKISKDQNLSQINNKSSEFLSNKINLCNLETKSQLFLNQRANIINNTLIYGKKKVQPIGINKAPLIDLNKQVQFLPNSSCNNRKVNEFSQSSDCYSMDIVSMQSNLSEGTKNQNGISLDVNFETAVLKDYLKALSLHFRKNETIDDDLIFNCSEDNSRIIHNDDSSINVLNTSGINKSLSFGNDKNSNVNNNHNFMFNENFNEDILKNDMLDFDEENVIFSQNPQIINVIRNTADYQKLDRNSSLICSSNGYISPHINSQIPNDLYYYITSYQSHLQQSCQPKNVNGRENYLFGSFTNNSENMESAIEHLPNLVKNYFFKNSKSSI